MTRLLFATNNQHKIEEIRTVVGNFVHVEGLKESGILIDIAEPYDTLEENAREKASKIYALTGMSCFSEDTGLEVTALGGAPGALSARYAGDDKSSEDNIDKLLSRLVPENNRMARFRTVIYLIWNGREISFVGICEGQITRVRRGSGGFGYDSVFQPSGSPLTFGEMSLEEKNRYSHRRKAADQLVLFLQHHI